MGKKQIFKVGDPVPAVPAGAGLVQHQIPWGDAGGTGHISPLVLFNGLASVAPNAIDTGNYKGVSADYKTRTVL